MSDDQIEAGRSSSKLEDMELYDFLARIHQMGESQMTRDATEHWIAKREKAVRSSMRKRNHLAGWQTFLLGSVTFGVGPIPLNMALQRNLKKKIVHHYGLDNPRLKAYLSSLGFGAQEALVEVGIKVIEGAAEIVVEESFAGVLPVAGSAVSATIVASHLKKTGKKTMAKCTSITRELIAKVFIEHLDVTAGSQPMPAPTDLARSQGPDNGFVAPPTTPLSGSGQFEDPHHHHQQQILGDQIGAFVRSLTGSGNVPPPANPPAPSPAYNIPTPDHQRADTGPYGSQSCLIEHNLTAAEKMQKQYDDWAAGRSTGNATN